MATPGRKRSDLAGLRKSKGKKAKLPPIQSGALVRGVADDLHLPIETIEGIWNAVNASIVEHLSQGKDVIVRGFGTFKARTINKGTTISVRFKAARLTRAAIKEALVTMEKYGVELNNENALLAKVTGKCPVCKAELVQIEPPNCSNCGTAPFEKKAVSQSPVVEEE